MILESRRGPLATSSTAKMQHTNCGEQCCNHLRQTDTQTHRQRVQMHNSTTHNPPTYLFEQSNTSTICRNNSSDSTICGRKPLKRPNPRPFPDKGIRPPHSSERTRTDRTRHPDLLRQSCSITHLHPSRRSKLWKLRERLPNMPAITAMDQVRR